jgi:hypothetical protein
MVCALSTGVGEFEHHQHAMAAWAGLDFAQRSGQYPEGPLYNVSSQTAQADNLKSVWPRTDR